MATSKTKSEAIGSETLSTLNQRQTPSDEGSSRDAYAGHEAAAPALSRGSMSAEGSGGHDASTVPDEKALGTAVLEGDDVIRDSSTITAGDNDGHEEVQEKGSNPTVVTYPEGGLRAWLVVMGAFWCTFFTWGFVNA